MAVERPQDQLLRALANVGEATNFCVSGEMPIISPGLEITGLGEIGLPISAAAAKRLIKQAEQAPYGLGEETVLDTSVRRVWQIGDQAVTFTNSDWPNFVRDVADEIAAEFGIKQDIKADFYKLLVYEKGSFFTAHRDTEKAPGMFATLVIALPSKHKGGELVVSHAGQTERISFDSKRSTSSIQYAAFFADCLHEVTPVESGYRVCLVYNLSVPRLKKQPAGPKQFSSIKYLSELLIQIFAEGTQEKIAIPLAHEYSHEGLTLGMLKGHDSEMVDAIGLACEQGGFEAQLAALEIMQSGSPDYSTVTFPSRRSRRYWDDDDEFSDADVESADFEEVYDERWDINCFCSLNGKPAIYDFLTVEVAELVAKDPLEDWPRKQTVTEATGNEGATMERWYRRTCVVIWPKAGTLAVLAKEGPDLALPRLQTLIDETPHPESSKECRDFAAAILKHWGKTKRTEVWYRRTAKNESKRSLKMADAIAALQDAALAKTFLRHVLPTECCGEEGAALVTLMNQIGWEPFRSSLLKCFEGKRNQPERRSESISDFADLLRQLCCSGPMPTPERVAVCRALTDEMTAAIHSFDNVPIDDWRTSHLKQDDLIVPLILSLAAVGDAERLDQFIKSVIVQPKRYDLHTKVIPAVQELFASPAINGLLGDARKRLHAHATGELKKLIEVPPQPPIDWTRDANVKCFGRMVCRDCQELNAFLQNATEQSHAFARPEAARRHLESQISSSRCDLKHQTIKAKSPHTLLCTKTDASYQRRLMAFQENSEHLAKLEALMPKAAKGARNRNASSSKDSLDHASEAAPVEFLSVTF